MKVIITGTSGMVGKAVLLECLENDAIEHVLVVNRSSINFKHPKITEVIHQDFFSLTPIRSKLVGYDACYFCLGVSSAGMAEAEYSRYTYDLTMEMARTLAEDSPNMTFCYVSGAGTEYGSTTMWAHIKGKTENAIRGLRFKKTFMFRPGYIHPMKGVKSKTALYNAVYIFSKPLFPIFKHMLKNHLSTSVQVGQAMINVSIDGFEQSILEIKDINKLSRLN